MIWWSNPFPRNDARECNAYACCSVQPGWGRLARQFLAEMTGEVIAVVGKEVVGRSLKILRDFFDYILDLVLRAESEALQQLATKRASGWLRVWLCPVYT